MGGRNGEIGALKRRKNHLRKFDRRDSLGRLGEKRLLNRGTSSTYEAGKDFPDQLQRDEKEGGRRSLWWGEKKRS